MTVALIALAVALGGTSYAAWQLPKNSVGTTQLRNGAVTGPKLRNGAVTGAKVAKNSLTGKQINAATLRTVPNATHARSADSAITARNATNLGGQPAASYLPSGAIQRFDFNLSATVSPWPPPIFTRPAGKQLVSAYGFDVEGICQYGNDVYATLWTWLPDASASNASNASYVDSGNNAHTASLSGIGGELISLDSGTSGASANGSIILRSASHTITATFHIYAYADHLGAVKCEFQGNAVIS
jgi:hypothetical protein